MKLYLFQCGTIMTKKHLLVKDRGVGQPFEVPVPFYLIEHPKGLLLFDVGQSLSEALDDEARRILKFDRDYVSIMAKDDYAATQLAKAGIDPLSISHVVLSHLHSDHCGGMSGFPKALFHLRRAELSNPDEEARFKDVRVHLLDDEALYDVFEDGQVKILFTPGHTPGHQSLLLKLGESGQILLASDSIYTDEILNDHALPGVAWDMPVAQNTIEKIRCLSRAGVRVISGHDPSGWMKLKLWPSFYE